ncbi:hypothetical protein DITRI_Ditri09bG0067300 [Diplodiscus trichospermus]
MDDKEIYHKLLKLIQIIKRQYEEKNNELLSHVSSLEKDVKQIQVKLKKVRSKALDSIREFEKRLIEEFGAIADGAMPDGCKAEKAESSQDKAKELAKIANLKEKEKYAAQEKCKRRKIVVEAAPSPACTLEDEALTKRRQFYQDYRRALALMQGGNSVLSRKKFAIEYGGTYPRITVFPNGLTEKELAIFYKFGFLDRVYLDPEELNMIKLLPQSINKGVRDYVNGVKPKNKLCLKFISAAPDELHGVNVLVKIGSVSPIKFRFQQKQVKDDGLEVSREFVVERRAIGFLVMCRDLGKAIGSKKFWLYTVTDKVIVYSYKDNKEAQDVNVRALVAKAEKINSNKMDAEDDVKDKFCELANQDKTIKHKCFKCKKEASKNEEVSDEDLIIIM